jgi:peptidoglycan/LPS O-acetylase OafA/YrhL
MSSDLIAWVVAVTLGIAVVVLGLQRNLSDTTRWLVSFYLLIALADAALAVLSADNRLLHASTAGLFALGVVFLLSQGSSHPSDQSAS